MSKPAKLHVGDLVRELGQVEANLDRLTVRREEIRDLLRVRVMRSLSCVGYGGKANARDVAIALAEEMPQVREALGFKTFSETAAWLLQTGGHRE